MSNREVLEQTEGLAPESIADILETAEKVGIGAITQAQISLGQVGKILEVANSSGSMYYFGLSEYGFVEIVRAGTLFGEILYIPMDD